VTVEVVAQEAGVAVVQAVAVATVPADPSATAAPPSPMLALVQRTRSPTRTAKPRPVSTAKNL
jgi:hypothetical protein